MKVCSGRPTRVTIERKPSVAIQDPFNPATRAYVFDQLRRNYMRYGINLFWLDEAEPERHQQDIGIRYQYHAGTDSEVVISLMSPQSSRAGRPRSRLVAWGLEGCRGHARCSHDGFCP